MKKQNATIIICVIFTFVFVACSAPKKAEPLKIGYIHEPPYSYVSEQGDATGIFPEAARQIAKDLHYSNIEWVLLSFDNLLPALHDGRIDVIAAGMTNVPIRVEDACFSTPLVTSKSAALWSAEHNSTFDPLLPLTEQNMTYAVVNGSVEAIYLKKRIPTHRVIEIEDAYVGLYILEQKQADVLLLTEPSLQYLAQANKDKYRVNKTSVFLDDTHNVAFVFTSKDKEFAKRWNKVQVALMQTPSFADTINNYAFSIPLPESRKEPICDVS